MKKTLLILSVLFFYMTGFSQTVPQGVNYQAVARDATGIELANQSLTVQFSVIAGIPTGAEAWQETHSVLTNDFGSFTAVIGQGISTGLGSSASFDAIDWGSSPHYLKVEVDAGSGYVDMGTNEFLSVPYAFMSASDGDWEIGAYGHLENAEKDWVRIVGNDTLGELMIAPSDLLMPNHKSQLLLMEDYYGNFGMNLHYDGSDNKFKVFGKNTIDGEVGPWFTIARDNGQIQMPAGAQQDYVLVTDSLGNANWTDPSTFGDNLWEEDGSKTYLKDTSNSVGIGTYSPRGGLEIRKDYDMGYAAVFGDYTSNAHLSLVDDGQCASGPMVPTLGATEDYTAWMSFGNSQSSGKWLMGGRPNSFCSGSMSSTYYLPEFKLKYFNSSSSGYTDVLHITQVGSSKMAIGTSNPLAHLHVMGSTSSADLLLTPDGFNENSSIFLAEDDAGSLGMKLQYDGDKNWLYFIGEDGSTSEKQISFKRNGSDATLSDGSGFMVIGQEDGLNIVFDNNEIIARDDESGATLYLARESGSDVAIGSVDVPSGYKLSVDGKVICEELRVELSGSWPDYVFGNEYNLMPLVELEKYIEKNHHLPGVPPAHKVEDSGIAMGEMTKIMMEKVEELTLYLIEANKRISDLEKQIKVLNK